jgi:hypothetical protein
MIQSTFFLALLFLMQTPKPASDAPLEKSAYFAFVDRDYIFTIEVVKQGIPLFNFISLTNEENSIPAKNIRLTLENRKAAAKFLTIDTGDRQPIAVFSAAVHPRSSFGYKLNGDFGEIKEIWGATIQMGSEDFKLAPLKSFDFEALAVKINRINLGSPDFSGDFKVLDLKPIGTRSRAKK